MLCQNVALSLGACVSIHIADGLIDVGLMMEEKDLWQQACYALAIKVAEECRLQTLQRLQLSEKSWVKLAEHFAIFLSDRDTDQVRKGRVKEPQEWRQLTLN